MDRLETRSERPAIALCFHAYYRVATKIVWCLSVPLVKMLQTVHENKVSKNIDTCVECMQPNMLHPTSKLFSLCFLSFVA
jgi:hypothetical protein